MTKSLETHGKMRRVALIENQLVRRPIRPGSKAAALVVDAAATPRGVVPRSVSMPLCPTPFSLLAMPEVSE